MAGLRQGELLGLRWRAMDLSNSRLRVEENLVRAKRTTPKSRERRSVPLAPAVARALLALQDVSPWRRATDPVFATPSTGQPMGRTKLMERYGKALEAAGLDPAFKFHHLRHTFGTQAAKAGQPVTTIQAWMGHSDLRTTQIYMHYAPAHDEAAALGRAFAVADPRHQSGTNLSAADPAEVPAAA